MSRLLRLCGWIVFAIALAVMAAPFTAIVGWPVAAVAAFLICFLGGCLLEASRHARMQRARP